MKSCRKVADHLIARPTHIFYCKKTRQLWSRLCVLKYLTNSASSYSWIVLSVPCCLHQMTVLVGKGCQWIQDRLPIILWVYNIRISSLLFLFLFSSLLFSSLLFSSLLFSSLLFSSLLFSSLLFSSLLFSSLLFSSLLFSFLLLSSLF